MATALRYLRVVGLSLAGAAIALTVCALAFFGAALIVLGLSVVF